MANFKNQDVMSLEAQLAEKTEKFTGKIDFLSSTLLTWPQYTSATRLTMLVNHIKQFNTMNDPEFPRLFGGYENTFGRESSGLVKADVDFEVYAKVDKFVDFPNHLYLLFIYDADNDKYDVIQKKLVEELTENYGFRYNNAFLDTLKPGDVVKHGTTIYKSSSYDEDDNYRFGKNALIGCILAPGNIEDAYIFRKGFAKGMVSIKNTSVFFGVNDNDFLLNTYGDSNHYKSFPDIGEDVQKRIISCKRRIINDQILYDMKKSNMMKIQPLNDKPFYTMGGKVMDIDIYSNKKMEDIPNTIYNQQILYYLQNQTRYIKEVNSVCEEIVKSGSSYSDDIGWIYEQTKEYLDPNYIWKNGDSEFSNYMIDIKVTRDIPINIGSKTAGRYGDKGVVSELVDDDKMPYLILEDGTRRPLDIIKNPLSHPNRLNPFGWAEISFNHSSNKIAEQCKKMKTNEERFAHLYKYLSYFNEYGARDVTEREYNKLSEKGKDRFWKSIYKDGIFLNYPPMWDDRPMIEKIEAIRKEFHIERDQLYIDKWGRTGIPLMNKIIVGEEYMLKLKQTSEKGFSARSTGYLSQKGIPDKSNKVKSNENLYSTTPIALGRDENNNLGIGVPPFIMAKMHLFYRTSPLARRETSKMYTNNVLKQKKFKIKKGFTNRNVEILNAKTKTLGIKFQFPFDGMQLWVDDGQLRSWEWKGSMYILTKTQMRELILDELLRKNFFTNKKKKLPKEQAEKEYQDYKAMWINRFNGGLSIGVDE